MATIMIIDDDDLILESTRLALEKEGYEVVTAFGGLDALEALKTKRPDLILLDIMMPGLDGWETLEKLKGSKSAAEIPVIIFTVKGIADELKSKREALGDFGYIVKPFKLEALYSQISKALHIS